MRRTELRRFIIVCLTAFISANAAVVAYAEERTAPDDDRTATALVADHVLRPDGSLKKDLAVVVRDGKIKRVGKHDGKPTGEVRRFPPGAVISPGLLDLFAYPGVVGQTVETAKFIDPEASPVDVLDPSHADLRTALHSGITAVMVAPTPANLVNGTCVCVRTYAKDGQLEILRDDGPLVLAFGDGVWRSDRAPTSRAGAVHEFRALLGQARNESSHPRLNAAVAGQLDAWIVCPSGLDLAVVQEALGGDADHFGVVHTLDALEFVKPLKAFRQPIVVGPYALTSDQRVLLGASALSDAGIEIAFRGGFPESSFNSLRMTASLAVRHGMDPNKARRSMTAVPADVAGVAKRIGSITPGRDADLVVFSGDPLRMDSKVLEVYVQGVRVYVAK